MRPSFLDLVRQRVVFLDGAMGTSIHTYDLDLKKDYLGHENCTEILIETRPDVIREIHESFLAVGCDAIDEPCTKKIVPLAASPALLRQRKSLMSPLRVQCSVPFIAA